MTTPLDGLLKLLDIEQIEVNIFRGANPHDDRKRLFGGQVAAQALMAAGRTVTKGRVHSLHSYFLLPGDPEIPVLYEVDRIRDGKSFTTRRVIAIQHGRAIFNLQASFHEDEPSAIEHHGRMPQVPPPEDLLPLAERIRQEGSEELNKSWLARPFAVEHRYVGVLPWFEAHSVEPVQNVWVKAAGTLPDNRLLHACVIAFASDLALLPTALLPHNVEWSRVMLATIDHCMWFHRPVKADEWLLYTMDSPSAYGSRGLTRGMLFDREGTLLISLVQEGLTRLLS